jgi:hypothetical protein
LISLWTGTGIDGSLKVGSWIDRIIHATVDG